jgi:hypothetical protein
MRTGDGEMEPGEKHQQGSEAERGGEEENTGGEGPVWGRRWDALKVHGSRNLFGSVP